MSILRIRLLLMMTIVLFSGLTTHGIDINDHAILPLAVVDTTDAAITPDDILATASPQISTDIIAPASTTDDFITPDINSVSQTTLNQQARPYPRHNRPNAPQETATGFNLATTWMPLSNDITTSWLEDNAMQPAQVLAPADNPLVPQQPGQIIVNSYADDRADDGYCTLREALLTIQTAQPSGNAPGECNPGETLNLGNLDGDIVLTAPLPDINTRLTINGPGAVLLTLRRHSESPTFPILRITGDAALTLNGITLSGGHGVRGGALTIESGRVSLNDVIAQGNTANDGGAIYNAGTLNLYHVQLNGNNANGAGGGLYNIGTAHIERSTIAGNLSYQAAGIYSGGTLTMVNSTISSNTSLADGGGLYQAGAQGDLQNVTIADNVADPLAENQATGGGIYVADGATLTLRNTLVSDNTAATRADSCAGTLTLAAPNILSAPAAHCTLEGNINSAITNVTIDLAELNDWGGFTPTHALLPDSAALAAGRDCAVVDQRGMARNDGCDIGAHQGIQTPVNNAAMRALEQAMTSIDTPLNTAVCQAEVELMLVLDGSGSISISDFETMKGFARSVLDAFVVGPSAARIGLVQFSSSARLELELSANPNTIDAAISTMGKMGGGTDIGRGIDMAQSQISSRGRAGVPRVMMVLTDGVSGGAPEAAADAAKAAGTVIFGIAVGGADIGQIEAIASDPDSDYVFSVSGFSQLLTILNQLIENACTLPIPSVSVSPSSLRGLTTGDEQNLTFTVTNSGAPSDLFYLDVTLSDSVQLMSADGAWDVSSPGDLRWQVGDTLSPSRRSGYTHAQASSTIGENESRSYNMRVRILESGNQWLHYRVGMNPQGTQPSFAAPDTFQRDPVSGATRDETGWTAYLLDVNSTSDLQAIANATPNHIDPGGTAVLDGTDSTGNPDTYFWQYAYGPQSVYPQNNQSDTSRVTLAQEGAYLYELTVERDGITSSDTVQISVGDYPFADAGDDQIGITVGDTVTLDGSGSSDPLGRSLDYAWRQIAGPRNVSLRNGDSTNPTFTLLQDGFYEFELIVTAYNNSTPMSSAPDTVRIGSGEGDVVSGVVYQDSNSNGSYDAGTDQPVNGARVTSGDQQALTSSDGFYSLTLPAGEHDISAVSSSGSDTGYAYGVQVTAGNPVVVNIPIGRGNCVTIAGVEVCAQDLTETSPGVYTGNSNVRIGSHVLIDGDVVADLNALSVTGSGIVRFSLGNGTSWEIYQGSYTINTATAELVMSQILSRALTEIAGLYISSEPTITIDINGSLTIENATIDIQKPSPVRATLSTFTVNNRGRFNGTVSEFTTELGGLNLTISDARFDNNGVVGNGSLQLPQSLGGGVISINGVGITSDGLQFSEIVLDNQTVNIGGMQGRITHAVLDNKGIVASGELRIPSDLTPKPVRFSGITITRDGFEGGTVSLDEVGDIRIGPANFRMEQAQLDMQRVNGSLTAVISVGKATMKLDAGIGGTSTQVEGIRISNTGVTFERGEIVMPTIKWGRFEISGAKVSIEKRNPGYGFAGEGTLRIGGLFSGGRDGSITAEVQIYLSNGSIQFERGSIYLRGTRIPVGQTGAFIVGIYGEVDFTQRDAAQFTVGIDLEAGPNIAGYTALSGDVRTTINLSGWVRASGRLKLMMHEITEVSLSINEPGYSQNGVRVAAKVNIYSVILGDTSLYIYRQSSGGIELEGSANVTVQLPLGELPGWAKTIIKKVYGDVENIPLARASARLGRFLDGDYAFKMNTSVLKPRSDDTLLDIVLTINLERFDFDVDLKGGVWSIFGFMPAHSTMIDGSTIEDPVFRTHIRRAARYVTVPGIAPQQQVRMDSSLISLTGVTEYVVFALDYAESPHLTFSLLTPDGQTVNASNVDQFLNIDLYQDSENAVYYVDQPAAGDWYMTVDNVQSGDIYSTDAYFRNSLPTVTPQTITPQGNDYNISWLANDLESNATISLYYDIDDVGFDGTKIADNLALNTSPYLWATQDIATGDYHLYISVDDGDNAPVLIYFDASVTVTNTIPPAVPGNINTRAGVDSIIVTWDAVPDGDVDGYVVKYGLTDPPTDELITNVTETTVPRTHFDQPTYITVMAYDTSGNDGAISPTLTIPAFRVDDTTPPTVPANVGATLNVLDVQLTWDAALAEADLAGYNVYYNDSPITPYTGIGASEGTSPVYVTTNSATLSNLPIGTMYFAVTALDNDGNESTYSTLVPLAVIDSANTDGDTLPDAYEMAYWGNLTATDGTLDSDGDGLTDADELANNTLPLSADTDQDGWLDGDEIASGSNPLDPTSTPLISISTTELPVGVVNTTYNASMAIDTGTTPITWSILHGALPLGLTLNNDGSISGTPQQHGNFFVTIRAVDATGQVQSRRFVIVVYQVALPAPSNLQATALDGDSLRLTWTDDSANETAYIIERSQDSGLTWQQIADLAADSTQYDDDNLQADITYQYRVRAYNNDAQQYSPFSDIISAVLDFCHTVIDVPYGDCHALATLYEANGGAMWTTQSNWLQATTVCTWAGISCQNGRVTGLNLTDAGVSGDLPDAISTLTALTSLQLGQNNITALPDAIGDLSNLNTLTLNSNSLTQLPATISNLTALNTLDIGYNSLSIVDGDLTAFVATRDADWFQTQTIAPANVSANMSTPTGPVTTLTTGAPVVVTWDAIAYTDDGGYYEVGYTADEYGEFIVVGQTDDKTTTSHTINGLLSETDYRFAVRTITPAHTMQSNTLTSAFSTPVTLTLAPPNDDFDSALTVTRLPFNDWAETSAARTANNEPVSSCSSTPTHSLWYVYAANSEIPLELTTTGTTYDTVISVFTRANENAPLVEIACADDTHADMTSTITMLTTPGTTYYVRAASDGDVSGALSFAMDVVDPPPNDEIAQAINMDTLPFTDAQTVLASSWSYGDPTPSCRSTFRTSVWYTITPTADTYLEINTFGSDYDTALGIWYADTLGEVECDDNSGSNGTSSIVLPVTGGQTYLIGVVSDKMLIGGNLQINAMDVAHLIAPNDERDQAITLGTLPYSHTLDTRYSFAANSDPNPSCANNVDRTVWYQYNPMSDGVWQFSTQGSSFNPTVSIWQNNNGTLTELACVTNNADLNIPARSGNTYYLMVGHANFGNGGNLVLNVRDITALVPPNDNINMPQVITSLPFSQRSDVFYTFDEPDDPQPGCRPNITNTVWYQYTPTTDGALDIDTNGSNFDTVLAVYRGTLDALSQFACNDEGGNSGSTSSVRLRVQAGVTYRILVARDSSNITDRYILQLNITDISNQVPTNDTIDKAAPITALPYSDTQNTRMAFGDDRLPTTICYYNYSGSVWYRYQPTQSQTVRIDTTGSDYDVALTVMTGETDNLIDIGCAVSTYYTPTNLTISVDAGRTYYIRAAAYNNTNSQLRLTINRQDVYAPPHDDFEQAQAISTLPYRTQVNLGNAWNVDDDPRPACNTSQQRHTVWYRFMGDGSTLQIRALDYADTSTVLSIYTGARGSLQSQSCMSSSYPQVQFSTQPGTMYYVMFSTNGTPTRPITLEVSDVSNLVPVNAMREHAINITALPYTHSPNTDYANSSSLPKSSCGDVINKRVWYKLDGNGNRFSANTVNSSYDTILTIWRMNGDTLTQVTCDDSSAGNNWSRTTWDTEAGITYYLTVDGDNGLSGDVQLEVLDLMAYPADNDAFDNARIINALPYTDTRYTEGATNADTDPIVSCGTPYRSIWYTYNANNEDLVITTDGMFYGTHLSVWTGTHGNLTEVGCTTGERLNLTNLSGTVYIMVATHYYNHADLIKLDVVAAPTNNTIDNATLIDPLPYSITGLDTRYAFRTDSEPTDCRTAYNSVWYRYAGNGNSINLTTEGTDYGTVAVIYEGTPDSQSRLYCRASSSATSQANFTWQTKANTDYYVLVGSYSQNVTGRLFMTVRDVSVANDDFDNALAIDLTNLPYTTTQDITSAFRADDDPTDCRTTYQTVWYTFDGDGKTLHLDTANSDMGTVLAVYIGTRDNLNRVGCAARSSPSDTSPYLNLATTPGTTYYIMVGSYYSNQAGDIRLTVDDITIDNDRLVNAKSVMNLPYTDTLNNRNALNDADRPTTCRTYYNSVWYTYEGDGKAIRFSTGYSDHGTVIAIFSGPPDALVEETCTYRSSGYEGISPNLLFQTQPGVTYTLLAGSYYNGGGDTLNVMVDDVTITHDNIANALPISAGQRDTTENVGLASTTGDDPIPSCRTTFYDSLWYQYVGDSDPITLHTYGTNYGRILSVYTGTADNLTEVACQYTTSSHTTQTTQIDLPTTNGTVYTVMLAATYETGTSHTAVLSLVKSATNDEAQQAKPVTTLPYQDVVNMDSATMTNDPTPSCGSNSTRSVWYTLTGSNSAWQFERIDATNQNIPISIWTGTPANLTEVMCDANNNVSRFVPQSGTTYYVMIAGYNPRMVTMNISEFVPTIDHDDFNNALSLGNLDENNFHDTVWVGNLSTAYDDPQPTCITYPLNDTAWYRYDGDGAALQLNRNDNNPPEALAIYTGTRGNLTQIACTDWQREQQFNLQTQANTTYYILAGRNWDYSDSLRLWAYRLTTMPVNDSLANATPIDTLPFNETLDASGANHQADDPLPSCGINPAHSVWYEWVGNGQPVIFSTAGSNLDTLLSIWTGTPGNLTEIACNGDAVSDDGRIMLNSTLNTTYRILVQGERGDLGTSLQLKLMNDSTNDDFDNAIAIDTLPFEYVSSNLNATRANDDPDIPCYNNTEQTVWYSYQADGQVVEFNANTSSFNTVMAVYTGTRGNLTRITCDSNEQGIRINTQPGQTYHIMVASQGINGGDVVMRAFVPDDLKPNDLIENAEFLDITQRPLNIYLNTVKGSITPDEPLPTCGIQESYPIANTLWYRFTGDGSRINIQRGNTNVDPRFVIYDADTMTARACHYYDLDFETLNGQDYYLSISTVNSYVSYMYFDILTAPTMLNDNDTFDAAQAITIPIMETRNVSNATIGADDPQASCHPYQGHSVWYEFVGDGNPVTLRTRDSSYNTTLSVWTGTRGNLTEIACDTDGDNSGRSRLTFTPTNNTTYYIMVTSRDWTAGTLHLDALRLPNNDTYANRQAITLPHFDARTTDTAQTDVPANKIPSCDTTVTYTLWYTFTGTGNPVNIDTRSTAYSRVVAIWDASGQEVLCSTSWTADIPTNNGETYTMLIANQYSTPDDLFFSIESQPANDDFDTPVIINSLPYTVTQNLIPAEQANDDPNPTCYSNRYDTVWYRYTGTDNVVRITAEPLDFEDMSLSIWTGTRGNLTSVGCTYTNYSGTLNRVLLADSGTDYYIMVAGTNTSNGQMRLTVEDISIANDDVDNATTIDLSALPFTDSVNHQEALTSDDDPNPTCYTNRYDTIWYAFEGDGKTLRITADPLDYSDMSLSVYTGTRGNLTSIGCGYTSYDDARSLVVPTQANETYYVMVAGTDSNTGTVELQVEDISIANDDFDNATIVDLSALPFADSVNHQEAIASDDDPNPTCYTNRYDTIWYAFEGDGKTLRITADPLDYSDMSLSVYTGTRGNLTSIGCGYTSYDDARSLLIPTQMGETYYLMIAGTDSNTGTIELSIEDVTIANDDFDNATTIDLTALPFNTSINPDAAMVSDDDPIPTCYSSRYDTIWYRFTGDGSALRIISESLDSHYITMSIWTGTRGNLVSVDCRYFNSQGIINLLTQANTDYYIMIAGRYDSNGNITLALEDISLAHDNALQPRLIDTLPYSDTVTASVATANNSDPTPSCRTNATNHTLWYRFVGTGERIALTNNGSSYAAAISVYGSNNNALYEIACNYHSYAGYTQVAFDTTMGETYTILVRDEGTSGELTLNALPMASNDAYTDAKPITSLPFNDHVMTTQATVAFDDPIPPCYSNINNTVWYRYTGTGQPITLNTLNSTYDVALAVYNAAGDLIACRNDYNSNYENRLNLTPLNGDTIYIMVANSNTGGELLFNAQSMSDLAPNDAFDNATIIDTLPFETSSDPRPATIASDDPRPSCLNTAYERYQTRWYRYVGAGDKLSLTSLDNVITAVYTGTVGNLTEIACNANGYPVNVAADNGQTYHIMLSFTDDVTYNGRIRANSIDAEVVNDDIANAIAIDTLPYQAPLDVLNATRSSDEPAPTCYASSTADRSVWYRLSNLDETLQFKADGSWPSAIMIWRDDDGQYTPLDCHYGSDAALTFTPQVDETYLVGVFVARSTSSYSTLNMSAIKALTNNDFSNARLIDTRPYSDARYIDDATNPLPGTGEICDTTIARGIWYRFTGDGTSWNLNTDQSNVNTVMALYTSDPTQSSPVLCLNGATTYPPQINVVTQPGTNYYVLAATATTTGIITVNANEKVLATNDVPDGATHIDSLPFSQQTTVADVGNGGEPLPSCGINVIQTTWYQYTGDGKPITFNVTYREAILAFYTGTPDNLTEQHCLPDAQSNTFTIPANQTVWLMVGARNYTYHQGDYTLSIDTANTAPELDNRTSAQVINALPYSYDGRNNKATRGLFDPADVCGQTPDRSLWFEWVGTGQLIEIDTTNATVDTLLGVYRVESDDSLTAIACDDNSGYGNTSRLRFASQLGMTYHIMLASPADSNATGFVHLNASVADETVPGDDFDAPLVVDTLPYTVTQHSALAVKAADDPQPDCTTHLDHTLWARLDGNGQWVRVDTAQSDYTTVLAAYTGTRGNLTQIACAAGSATQPTPYLNINTPNGTPVYILIGSRNVNAGNLKLTVETLTTPAIPNITAPSGNITTVPVFTWPVVPQVDTYTLNVRRNNDNGVVYDETMSANAICSDTTCTIDTVFLPDETYTWTLTATNSAGSSSTTPQTYTSTIALIDVMVGDVRGLRNAIHAANALGQPTTIVMDTNNATTMTFNQVADSMAHTMLPVITGNVTIVGNNTTLRRDTTSGIADMRFFTVAENARLRLENMTLSYGLMRGERGGGAILALGALELDNVRLTENEARYGGAVFAGHTLTTSNNTYFSHNRSGDTGVGGALFVAPSANATLTDTAFYRDNADWGGAIATLNGQLTLNNVTLNEHSATYGGGLYVQSDTGRTPPNDPTRVTLPDTLGMWQAQIDRPTSANVTITNSTIRSSNAPYGGGIRLYEGDLTLDSTYIYDNYSVWDGGGIEQRAGTLNITNSTLGQNNADRGGAIHREGGTLTITNSTFDDNRANHGVALSGGADVAYSTFVYNRTNQNGTTLQTTTQPFNLNAVLMAANNSANCDASTRNAMTSQYSLSDDASCQLNGTGDFNQTDPLLGSTISAGNIFTYPLQSGSPAIDHIPPADCTVSTDQVGMARPYRQTCDIGAWESQLAGGVLHPPADLQITAHTHDSVTLGWQDDNTTETSYRLERSDDGGTWVEIMTMNADITTTTDDTAPCDIALDYRMRAHRNEDNHYSDYSDVVSITLECLPPDLYATAFDSSDDLPITGDVLVSFTIANTGNLTGAIVGIYYSDDATCDSSDVQLDTVTLNGDSESTYTNLLLAIPRPLLYANALREDPPLTSGTATAQHTDTICLIIDPDNLITEGDEANNANTGLGVDSDDVTLFAWDVNDDAVVDESDAKLMRNALNTFNPTLDLDGDGVVSPLDAIHVINRRGYSLNTAVND